MRAKGETKIASERGVQPLAGVVFLRKPAGRVGRQRTPGGRGTNKVVEDRVDFGDWDVPKSFTRSKTRLSVGMNRDSSGSTHGHGLHDWKPGMRCAQIHLKRQRTDFQSFIVELGGAHYF